MATGRTESTQTYTKELVGNLQVVPIFQDLMKASTDKDSIYIRAKESLLAYFAQEDCILSEREQANMLVELISNMAVQMTAGSLNAAVQIAEKNVFLDYEASKAKEEVLTMQEQRDLIAAQNLKVGSDIDNSTQDKDLKVIQGWKLIAENNVENGVALTSMQDLDTKTLGITAISETGAKQAQTKQSLATINSLYSKAYRESGIISWSADNDGKLATAVPSAVSGTNEAGLTSAQTNVAIRQEEGFDDNMLQHVANSSASYLGILSGGDNFAAALEPVDGAGGILPTPMTLWGSAIAEINRRAIP